jgi:RHS repeat-associated protein
MIAVVTRGGLDAGTRYVHSDHLGSVDVLTEEDGAVVERRSYDPFGQRRNPIWGEPTAGAFQSRTSRGFTGHEMDDELGLVNMKGRVYDPRIGRFLTTDPLVSAPLSGQGWNPYSYVHGSPLSFVDPSGFADAEPDVEGSSSRPIATFYENILVLAPGATPDAPSELLDDPRGAAFEAGAAATPVDVSTTGNASGYVPQAVTAAPMDWRQTPLLQLEGGFVAGLLLGGVPFAGVAEQVLDATGILPDSTPEARVGLAIGQIVGGLFGVAGGIGGEVLGGVASATGGGAAIGVPAIAVSTAAVVGGAANVAAGIRGLAHVLLSEGTGNDTSRAAPSTGKSTTTYAGISDRVSKLIPGKNPNVYQVNTPEEMTKLFNDLSRGGKNVTPPTYKGTLVELQDGTLVGMRTASKSGGPTIDVKPPEGFGAKPLKVHLP